MAATTQPRTYGPVETTTRDTVTAAKGTRKRLKKRTAGSRLKAALAATR